MIKPHKLQRGDKVATISLSWGGAGLLPQRYAAGKQEIASQFGLQVVETKNALRSADWIYKNPEARAHDLMEALADKSIKAIISNIGGDDSIRILKYLDFDLIKNNPKIFLGFSDSTVTHFCFYKAGVTSFYGTSTMVGFAENNGMHDFQVKDIKRSLFSATPVGKINANPEGWTSEMLDWSDPDNQNQSRKLELATGFRFLQGSGRVQGHLLGGCVEVLENLKDTSVWVKPDNWKRKLMFLETSEEKLDPAHFCWILRNYAASGILSNISGLILGRPYDNKYWKAYDDTLLKVIAHEEGMTDLPIVTGMDFGHTCPTMTLPYGCLAEIDADNKTFSILESGVVDTLTKDDGNSKA